VASAELVVRHEGAFDTPFEPPAERQAVDALFRQTIAQVRLVIPRLEAARKVDIWTCNGTSAQVWTFANHQVSVLGKCLDDSTQGGADSPLVIWSCNGHKAQTWAHFANGEYVLALNHLCLTDPSDSTTNGTRSRSTSARTTATSSGRSPDNRRACPPRKERGGHDRVVRGPNRPGLIGRE
jgi:hypothetical protein